MIHVVLNVVPKPNLLYQVGKLKPLTSSLFQERKIPGQDSLMSNVIITAELLLVKLY